MHRVVIAALVAACTRNPNYCPGANPNNNCAERDAAPSGACTGDGDCAAVAPVCDLATRTCVECTPARAERCTGATPVCGAGGACRGCASHAECSSAACRPDGACAAEPEVAYVAAGGGGTACTRGAPCGTLAAGLATRRPIVKLAAGLVEDPQPTAIEGRAVAILGDPGARLDRIGDGPILVVRGAGTDAAIYDLELTGASGAAGANAIELQPAGGSPRLALVRVRLIANQGAGVSATGGTLVMQRCTVRGNTGGGLSLTATELELENNVIAKNGSVGSAFGGVALAQLGAGTHRLEFNTIAANGGATGATTGVVCSLITQPVVLSNNIVFANQTSGGGAQVGGAGCAWTYSDIGPEAAAGAGNFAADPLFAAAALDDFHLTAGSPARDRADPVATLRDDLDGEPRPQGAGRDVGADEVVP